MFEVELPWPPSINHYWRHVGYRILISREGRKFRDQVVAILVARHLVPMAGPLQIELHFSPPDNRRRDVDNLLKSTLDALQHGGAYVDDSQIMDLHARKGKPRPPGMVHVTLRQVEDNGDDD